MSYNNTHNTPLPDWGTEYDSPTSYSSNESRSSPFQTPGPSFALRTNDYSSMTSSGIFRSHYRQQPNYDSIAMANPYESVRNSSQEWESLLGPNAPIPIPPLPELIGPVKPIPPPNQPNPAVAAGLRQYYRPQPPPAPTPQSFSSPSSSSSSSPTLPSIAPFQARGISNIPRQNHYGYANESNTSSFRAQSRPFNTRTLANKGREGFWLEQGTLRVEKKTKAELKSNKEDIATATAMAKQFQNKARRMVRTHIR